MTDFVKYQALGNDYLVVDPDRTDLALAPQAVALLCDRHFGIGADGLLCGPLGPVRRGQPVGLRIYNSDGGPCERSGNGLRMFALYLAEYHLPDTEFVLRTVTGDVRTWLREPGATGARMISVELGAPRLDAVDQPLPVAGQTLRMTRVHNGNPHTVVLAARPSSELARELGPLIAGHDSFAERTNVQFLRVLDRDTIHIEVWERGAGYTLASGSSACAATSAAHALGLVDGRVTVLMAGGQVQVQIADDAVVTMTGPVEPVMTGVFSPALRHRLAAAAAHELTGTAAARELAGTDVAR